MTPLAVLAVDGGDVVLRRAVRADVPALAALIADDAVARTRGDGGDDLAPYLRAFDAVDRDPAHLLVVAVDGGVVGTLQLSFVPGLSRRGALRAQVETVRVASTARGRGLGAAMVRWSVEESRRRGCSLVQLTSDRVREDAHRFYTRLGFEASHVGFKLDLEAPDGVGTPG